jgi:hypothetical protein
MYLKRFLFITLSILLVSCNDGVEDTAYMQRLEDIRVNIRKNG